MCPLEKGQRITLIVDRLTYGGEAVASYQDYQVLVQRGVPGDEVEIEVTSIHDDVVRAEITSVISPSPSRITPDCPAFHEGCGGCQWLQVDYSQQLVWKRRIVQEILRGHSDLADVTVHEVAGMDDPFYYRNKMVVRMRGPQDNLRVGFHTPRTKWVIGVFGKDSGECQIQNELNNRIGRGLAGSLSKERRPLKSATIRSSDNDEVNLDLDRKLAKAIGADLQGIGKQSDCVHYSVMGHRFRVTSPSFFQANTRQTSVLIQSVLDMLPQERMRVAIDVYCGVGLFTLFLAQMAERVYGIEESHRAIADAEHNANNAGLSNIEFLREKAENALPSVTATADGVDLIMVDPPRSGCDSEVLTTIAQCKPVQIIYVSCNVETLTRDLILLQDLGYRTAEIQPVDMFPHTYHIECVARCEKAT
jgi:23S rRNA (uracil1939-C5)-methyltransferase